MTLREWKVPLPYASPPLSLNDRLHPMVKHRWTKKLRGDAHVLALGYRLPRGLARVHVVLHWAPPDSRRRDTDNPVATLKPIIDGLRDYGLVHDDDAPHVSSECVIEAPTRPGTTWLTIEER